MDWTALETRLIQIGENGLAGHPDSSAGDTGHTRAWLICDGEADLPGITDLAAHWVIATPGCEPGESALDAKSLMLVFDASWPGGESLFHETTARSFSAEPYPQMEAAALTLLCFARNHLPDTGSTLPNSIADLHVYVGLKHRLDDWLEAFVGAMTAEGAVTTRLGVSDQRIQRAMRLLDAWPLEEPLDRARVAREASVTVAHLDRLFNTLLQRTPSRYFDNRRIAYARRSLSESDTTIKAIASELGFHSEAHFSHWFKQHQNTCPRSFRQAHVGQDQPGA